MAFIATVTILVDEANETSVYDGINEILRNAQMGGPNGEDRGWVVDWKFKSIKPANESLNDSIANETYAEGDAFNDWVIFSRSEAIAQDGAGFWSNEYGWTTLDLATKFEDASVRDLPHSAGMDAVWMLAPYGMSLPEILNQKVGPSAVYDWANRLGLPYARCKACEAETPTYDDVCAICGSGREEGGDHE